MTQPLKRTPFYEFHAARKARFVPYAGFEMPVQYPTGITQEHTAVRTGVGAFDVSHMGEFEFTGPDRNAFVNRLTCNDVGALADGQAQYSALLTDDGTFLDDCIVYRFDDKIMMVVNAANIEKDWRHVVERKGNANVRVKNISDDVALLAIQGPRSEALVQRSTSLDLSTIAYYHFAAGQVAGAQCFVARTGYTGEDGFELYFRPRDAAAVWRALVDEGGAVPCGLGARDSLRLEVGYPLFGNDIDETVNPYEARLGWIVKLDKGVPFVGREALAAVKQRGPQRRLVGFRCPDKGAIPRVGFDVYLNGRKVDRVRSGGFSPTLEVGIGTTYLPTHSTEPGTAVEIDVRGRRVAGEVVSLPFYTRGSVKRAPRMG
jgi:aminomethyltransferase